jgi:hypothetical protein
MAQFWIARVGSNIVAEYVALVDRLRMGDSIIAV